MTPSSQTPRTLVRLIGLATCFVFSAWYVLPHCHCQWEALFGDHAAPAHSSSLSFSADSPGPDLPCCCDDAPAKIFEGADGDTTSGSPQVSLFHPRTASQLTNPKGLLAACLGRGPPRQTRPHHPEPRTYLRHRALIL